MKPFCDECYQEVTGAKLDHCKSLKHSISRVFGDKERSELKESDRKQKSGRMLYYTKKGKTYELEILQKNIETLRPQTLLHDNTRMILVYLPTKSKEIPKNEENDTEAEFGNRAYFAVRKESITNPRTIITANSNELRERFKVTVIDSWAQSRWDVKDVFSWLNEDSQSNPQQIYQTMNELSHKYLDFENEYDYVYFNLWNIGTYCYELFDAYPYNDYTGTKRAGKSKSIEFQKLVCYNAIMSADMSGSAMFRTIEGTGATILLDETEQFKNPKNEQAQHLRTLLNQGFLRDQYAVRSEGKSDSGFSPVTFNLYSPKSMAHINSFDDILEDRAIPQLMRRSKDIEKLNNWPDDKKDFKFRQARSLGYRLFLDYGQEIYAIQDESRKLVDVSGRELKLWTPIITLALFFEKHGVKNLINAIKAKSERSSSERILLDEQESQDLRILTFLDSAGVGFCSDKSNIKGNPEGWGPTESLYQKLEVQMVELGINPEYYTRKKFTDTLRRLGLKSEKKVGGISWLVTRSEIDDVKERMGLIKPTENDDKQTFLELSSFSSKSSVSSVLGTDSTNETEPNELTEATEPDIQHSEPNGKTEPDEPNELSQNTQGSKSSVSSAKNEYWKCLECNNGPFHVADESRSSGNILNFHKKQGHSIQYMTEEQSKNPDKKKVLNN